jgi:hypothetical protein
VGAGEAQEFGTLGLRRPHGRKVTGYRVQGTGCVVPTWEGGGGRNGKSFERKKDDDLF